MPAEIRGLRENVSGSSRRLQGYTAKWADLAARSPHVAAYPLMQAADRGALQRHPEIRRDAAPHCGNIAPCRGSVEGSTAKCGGSVAISAHHVRLAPEID